MHLGQPHLPSPAWRHRLTTRADRRRRQLRALRSHLTRPEDLYNNCEGVKKEHQRLCELHQNSLRSFNTALAAIPAPALRKPAIAPVDGIAHPAAALALLKHYQQAHHQLTPSLEALKKQLESVLDNQEAVTLANEANTHRFPELDDWFKNHESALVTLASLAYSKNRLGNNLENLPESAESINARNLDEYRWLLPLSKSAERQFEQDSSQIDQVSASLANLNTHLGHNATLKRLMDDLNARHEQRNNLETALRQSRDQHLINEYREQMAHYSAELRALVTHATKVMTHSATTRAAINEDLKILTQAATHFESQLSTQVSFNPHTGAMTHWERQQDGSMCQVPVTDKEGNPIKLTPQEALQILKQMSEQYAEDGLGSPHKSSWWRKALLGQEGYTAHKDGGITLHFSSAHAKREFIERATHYRKQSNQQNRDRLNDGAANAREVISPAASARALT